MKQEISKVPFVIYIFGIILMLFSSLYIILSGKYSPTDRIQLGAYFLLGVAGYYMISKFKIIFKRKKNIKQEKKSKKKKSKFIHKLSKNLARSFVLAILLMQIVNIFVGLILMNSNLSNFLFILIWGFVVFGLSCGLLIFFGSLVIWKNSRLIKKIVLKIGKNKK